MSSSTISPRGSPTTSPTGVVELCIGIDLGTSGVRAVAMDAAGARVAQARVALPAPRFENVDGAERITQDAAIWWAQVQAVLDALLAQIDRSAVRALAVDGTSGTLLLTDAQGAPLTHGSMYNDASCRAEAARIAAVAPPDSAAHGGSSPLARLLHLQAGCPAAVHALHQADWIAACLCGRWGLSDENNALKLGYDVRERRWPAWLDRLGVRRALLPTAQAPGTRFGALTAEIAERFGLRADTHVMAGTTDGVAAFIATGADQVGDAVTSLGTTLVLKLLSDRPVFAPEFGIYSHRLGDRWLVGGASNTGGAALLRFFSADEMAALTPQLQPDAATGLGYYPLQGVGERFPVNDPAMTARVEPRPAEALRFFQGLLEGIAEVERLAYERIAALGAPALRSVRSVGGGAGNAGWTAIRGRALGVPMPAPQHEEAACGSARLAWQGLAAARRASEAGDAA